MTANRGRPDVRLLAAPSLIALINHFRGTQMLSPPRPGDLRQRRQTRSKKERSAFHRTRLTNRISKYATG